MGKVQKKSFSLTLKHKTTPLIRMIIANHYLHHLIKSSKIKARDSRFVKFTSLLLFILYSLYEGISLCLNICFNPYFIGLFFQTGKFLLTHIYLCNCIFFDDVIFLNFISKSRRNLSKTPLLLFINNSFFVDIAYLLLK